VRLGTKLVDEVTVKLPTGKIVVNAKARAKAKGRISAVGSDIRLYYGKGEEMTISDTAQPMEDRGLRYLSGDLLLLDDPTAQGPAGYPNALLETMPFKKQR
jgi:hypothetical protein